MATSQGSIERLRVKLPTGFDARRHLRGVLAKVAENHGTGWEVESVSTDEGQLTITRFAEITETAAREEGPETKVLRLAHGTKPSDGDKIAARFEDAHPGYRLTRFDPYLGQATMTQLSDDEVRCRGAVATALGVKPWDIEVAQARDGAFDLDLPKSYTPSKHYDKLAEVAEQIIGAPGWYVQVEAADLTARIIPGDLPVFDAAYPYPVGAKVDPLNLPIGRTLPALGGKPEVLSVDMGDKIGVLLQGLAGAGKAHPLSSRVPVPVSKLRPNGWARIGDLTNDDTVYSPTGREVPLAGFSDVHLDDCYDITFDDGQTVRVAAQHSWEVSNYASRTRHYQRERKHQGGVFDPTVVRLRSLLANTETGTFGTVAEIVTYAGAPEGRVRWAVESNEMAELTVTRSLPTGTYSTRRLRRYSVGEVAALFRAEGFGQDITGRSDDNWATPTELAFAAGIGTDVRAVDKVRMRLRKHQVTYRTVTERVEHKSSQFARAQKVYPVAEVLARMIAFYESARGRKPLLEVRTTQEMAQEMRARGGTHANWAVPATKPIDAPDVNPPVDPYLLGTWLGDGHSRSGTITVGNQDLAEQLPRLQELWPSVLDVGDDRDAAILRFPRPNTGQCKRGHHPHNWETPSAYPRYCRKCKNGGASDPIVHRSLTDHLIELDLRRSKHIPAPYLRASQTQRLKLLQGLMDTDGTISTRGSCELTLCDHRLATDALELIRSLGIKASMTSGDATLTEADPDNPGSKRRRVVGTRWRIHFTTDQQVFQLSRKAERLPSPGAISESNNWLYVTEIKPVGPHKVRCLRIDTTESMYLTDGFVPTHNSNTISGFIFGALTSGHRVAVINVPHKRADFEWMKPFVGENGWGADSLEQALTVATLVYEEGQRRGRLFDEHGVKKWQDLPAPVRAQHPIITLIVDELSALLIKEAIPKSLPKDHPMRIEAEEKAAARDMLTIMLTKLPAEMRAAGIRLLYASQQAQSNTGIPPAIKLNIPNRVLLGPNPSKQQRGHAFANPEKAPYVPEYITEDAGASRGVGVAEFEGRAPVVFKSYFAAEADLAAALRAAGTPLASQPEPTTAQTDRIVPRLDDDPDEGPPASRLSGEGGWGEQDGRDAPAPKLHGAAAAAHASRQIAIDG